MLSFTSSTSSLDSAFNKLNLQDTDLVEGESGLLDYAFSAALKQHFKEVIQVANHHWRFLKHDNLGNLSYVFIMLNRYLGFYFNVPELKNEPKPSTELLVKRLYQMLLMTIERLRNIESGFNKIVDVDDTRKCFADLCLLLAYFTHESIIASPENDPIQLTKMIGWARAAFKRIDAYPLHYKNSDLAKELNKFKQCLLQRLTILECKHIPAAFGFKEMQFHIQRKNALAQQKQTSYHAELIYNPQAFTQHQIDQTVLDTLMEKIERIKKGQQPRTQFIIDVLGIGHAMVLDISYDSTKDQMQMINVEPACTVFQADFLQQLISVLETKGLKSETVAIQTALLKDNYSCYTFSLALSGIVSRLSFNTLLQAKEIDQPVFLHLENAVHFKKLAHVTWRDVSALGVKAVMMGQSFSEMKENLLKVFPNKTSKDIETMIKDLKQNYGMGRTLPHNMNGEAHEESYIHLKRQSLRQKTKAEVYADLTVDHVLNRMNVKSPGMALRRLASGIGRSRDIKFLLKAHPEIIDEKSEKTGRTALHFAYANNKLSRAYHLEQANASLDILDNEGFKPRDLKKY